MVGGAIYDNANARGGAGNWWNNHDNRNYSRTWRNKHNDQNFGLNQKYWRDKDRNGRPSNGGNYNSDIKSFNGSNRSVNLNDGSSSRERSGDDKDYQDFVSCRAHNDNTRSRRARMDDGESQERER